MSVHEIREKLAAPFPESDIDWLPRPGRNKDSPSLVLMPFVDARAVRRRLDDVFGVFGWSNQLCYWQGNEHTSGGVVCLLQIKDPATGAVVTRCDGSEQTEVEPFKGGISGAWRRAAAALGIGAYLYEAPEFRLTLQNGGLKTDRSGRKKIDIAGTWYSYDPPRLPAHMLPKPAGSKQPEPAATVNGSHSQSGNGGAFRGVDARSLWRKVCDPAVRHSESQEAVVIAAERGLVSSREFQALSALSSARGYAEAGRVDKAIQCTHEECHAGKISEDVRDSVLRYIAKTFTQTLQVA